MRHLRLLSVFLLSTFVITGCHHRTEQAAPPPQAQAPIVSTLPPVPPLTFPDVQLEKPKPAPPVLQAVVTPPPVKKHTGRIHHRRAVHKTESETAANEAPTAGSAATGTTTPDAGTAPATGASVLGQLSADDATMNPHENVQTKHLIDRTEARLKRLSRTQRARHKEAIAQVESFLVQANQAWAMNDVVGATTLANKAKILMDELLK